MGEKMSLEMDVLVQDIRHLIYLDTQFNMRGETDLKLPEMQSLEARGWIAEGNENGEYEITEEGCRVIAVHLATPAQTVDVEAVRDVIANLDCVGSAGSDHYSSEYLQDAINDASDKLSQAIGDKT